MKALVVGYGSIGKRHINNLLSFTNVEVLVCTNRTDVNLNDKRVKVFSSLKECVSKKPNVSFITNVTNLHIPTALILAKNGVDLFIEKPLSDSNKHARELLNIVKKKRLVTLMGCNLRFNPCIIKIKQILSRNEIGRVISVRAECGSYLPHWHPYEDYRKSYAARQDLGGGVVLTIIHEIDYLYWLFGDVSQVSSITGKFSDLELKAEDLSASLLRFKNNIVAELHLDYFQRPSTRSCKIIGTGGTIIWNEENNTVKVYYAKKERWEEKIRLKSYDNNEEYIREVDHFLRCVKLRKNTINDVNQGVKTMKIALAIKKSSKTKKMVSVE